MDRDIEVYELTNEILDELERRDVKIDEFVASFSRALAAQVADIKDLFDREDEA